MITPIHKKEKPAENPHSYRRITVTPLIGEICKKELTSRVREVLNIITVLTSLDLIMTQPSSVRSS
jgi:hypothetical protein